MLELPDLVLFVGEEGEQLFAGFYGIIPVLSVEIVLVLSVDYAMEVTVLDLFRDRLYVADEEGGVARAKGFVRTGRFVLS